MKRLLALVTLAISTIGGFRAAIAARDKRIEELEGQVKQDEADDAALEQRAKDAELRASELQALDDEANGKADEFAKALNEEPAVPSVDPQTFAVTSPATETLTDLAFRERQDELTGKAGTSQPANPPETQSSEPAKNQEGEQNENRETQT